jgi:superfamily II DNA or RNA helicase
VSRQAVNADIRLGMSASYEREDGNQMQIEACVGSPVFKIEAGDLIEKGFIMKPIIYFFRYEDNNEYKGKYSDVYDKKIVNNVERNKLICGLSNKFGKNVLIIVNKIEHGNYFKSQMPDSVFIHGTVEQEEREKWLADMKKGGGKTIIGTASIIGKGLDIPNLDVMINTTGNLSAITTIQSLGRVLRKYDGKNNAYYVDFIDDNKYFKKHTERRMEVLKQQGHTVKVMSK